MTEQSLIDRLRELTTSPMPLPGAGNTPERHRRLMAAGRENLSLARLAEAHWDAIAILAEAGREPEPGALYGVWASEIPGQTLQFDEAGAVSGSKMFCSGAGLIDRALVTVGAALIDVDLHDSTVAFDHTVWATNAFRETRTAKATFRATPVSSDRHIGEPGWYLARPGFWHGACGPAACWAGGAAGLFDYAMRQSRNDPHTLAHLAAMHADVWALQSILDTAGREIDASTNDAKQARIRARTVRHLVEQAGTDILRRLPAPMARIRLRWTPISHAAIRNWICTSANVTPSATSKRSAMIF